jgi:hypothetical protein
MIPSLEIRREIEINNIENPNSKAAKEEMMSL